MSVGSYQPHVTAPYPQNPVRLDRLNELDPMKFQVLFTLSLTSMNRFTTRVNAPLETRLQKDLNRRLALNLTVFSLLSKLSILSSTPVNTVEYGRVLLYAHGWP